MSDQSSLILSSEEGENGLAMQFRPHKTFYEHDKGEEVEKWVMTNLGFDQIEVASDKIDLDNRSIMTFSLEGKEHKAKGSPMVPIGGELPYYVELTTSKLLNLLLDIFKDKVKGSRSAFRKKINQYLYPKTRPGFYMELNPNLHLAYADQRDGHGTQHWWRLFYNEKYREIVEKASRRTSLAVGSNQESSHSNYSDNNLHNGHKEWGGMYFRSECEIKIAQALDKSGLLFFANVRGRINEDNLPVSSPQINGRVELDFLIFNQGKALILEVDGNHHQEGGQTLRDYIRDRVLLSENIPTVRFTAQECFNNPTAVVKEVMQLFTK
jgi:very-short-patch-repair endonuclease